MCQGRPGSDGRAGPLLAEVPALSVIPSSSGVGPRAPPSVSVRSKGPAPVGRHQVGRGGLEGLDEFAELLLLHAARQ
ncbi:hypothetical protein ACWC3X_38045, partial [Streptomyces populi]